MTATTTELSRPATAPAPATPVPAAGPEVERCPICGSHPTWTGTVIRAGAVSECFRCGSWYRVPRPTLDELMRIYDKDYYKPWGLSEDESIAKATKTATFAPLFEKIESMLPSTPGHQLRILDVGAATGLLLELAESRHWAPYALELNPYSADLLRKRFGADHVFEGELTACTFPAASFDAVTMTDLIEHVLDVAGTLRAAARLLRPGGIVCITTPRVDSLTRRLMGCNWLHFKEEHIQYFSAFALRQALEQTDFGRIWIRPHSKALTFDYLRHQLQVYPHWLLTPVVGGSWRVLPAGLRRVPLRYRCGEMVAYGRRPDIRDIA